MGITISTTDKSIGAVFIMTAMELEDLGNECGIDIAQHLHRRIRERADASLENVTVGLDPHQRVAAAELTNLFLATIKRICFPDPQPPDSAP